MNTNFKRLHFIGIKGVGMSALALVAKGQGYQVSGSDVDEQFITDEPLKKAAIAVAVGFDKSHITPAIDLVVVSAAYGDSNPEVAAAKKAKVPVWTYSELLGYLTRQYQTLAVAGTHGKTTTTSILAFLLEGGDFSPSYVIGTGHIVGLPANGVAGAGSYFVTEADDYQRSPTDPRPKFLDLKPYGAIITSIEYDHPDVYPTLHNVVDAFYQFAARVEPKGFIVVNADDPNIKKIRARLADRRFISYGFSPDADYRISSSRTKVEAPIRFRLINSARDYGPFTLQLRGRHNIANASAAIVMALQVGVPEEVIRKILGDFVCVERRYQEIGRVGQQVLIDDYAHHPTSIRLTLATARAQYRRQPLWCFFQSHTYSRTKALLQEFGAAFSNADVVIVTDIFASAREQETTIKTDDLVRAIGRHHKNVLYVPRAELLNFLKKNLPADGIAITMGAGDIYKVGRQYVEQSETQRGSRYVEQSETQRGSRYVEQSETQQLNQYVKPSG